MSKIGLIIARELKSKLSNKTFIVMTILAPLLITGFVAFMIKMTQSEKTEQNVLVLDESKLFRDKLSGNDYVSLTYSNQKLEEAISQFYGKGFTCLLWISPTIVEGGAGATKLFYKKSPGFDIPRGQESKKPCNAPDVRRPLDFAPSAWLHLPVSTTFGVPATVGLSDIGSAKK